MDPGAGRIPDIDAIRWQANPILRRIGNGDGWPEERRRQSCAAPRAVIHALRNRPPVQEAARLAIDTSAALAGTAPAPARAGRETVPVPAEAETAGRDRYAALSPAGAGR